MADYRPPFSLAPIDVTFRDFFFVFCLDERLKMTFNKRRFFSLPADDSASPVLCEASGFIFSSWRAFSRVLSVISSFRPDGKRRLFFRASVALPVSGLNPVATTVDFSLFGVTGYFYPPPS